jgi:hypothetical protein
MGQPVLKNGEVVGQGGTVICTERGEASVRARGLGCIVVDPSKPVERFIV